MIINKVFNVNEEEELREVINNIPKLGCIRKLKEYIITECEGTSELEKSFVRTLSNDVEDFYIKLKIDLYFSKLSHEELLEKVKEMIKTSYPTDNDDIDYLMDRFTSEFEDVEVCGLIKKFMLETLDKVISKALETEAQKTINSLKAEYKNGENAIKGIQKYVDEMDGIRNRLKKEFGIEL